MGLDSSNASRFGEALTELGLEDKFFSSKEYTESSLLVKSNFVKGIIDKKLETGEWQEVIKRVYDSQIGQLYDGDKKRLNKNIVKSAKKCKDKIKDLDSVEEVLKENKQGDLAFRLAVNLSDDYKQFEKMTGVAFEADFFDNEDKEKRFKMYHNIAAKKALKEDNFRGAFDHLRELGRQDKINALYDSYLKEKNVGGYLLAQMALTDKERCKEKLTILVTENRIDPISSFKLYKEHNLPLNDKQKSKLIDKVAGELDSVDNDTFKDKLSVYYDWQLPEKEEIEIAWAKKNIEKNPRSAYWILNSYNEKQKDKEDFTNEINQAIIAGFNLITSNNEYDKRRGLDIPEIKEEHLRNIYDIVPFRTRKCIAYHLKDNDKLYALAKEAESINDFETAYNLFIDFRPNEKDIAPVRESLIEKCLRNEMDWLHKDDAYGKKVLFERAFNMENYEEFAYDVALGINDEKIIDDARQKLVEKFGLKNSLWRFTHRLHRHSIDSKGIDYIAKKASEKYNIDNDTIRRIISTS